VSTPVIFAPDIVKKYCALGVSDEAIYWVRRAEEAHIDTTQLRVNTLKRFCLFLIKEASERCPQFVQEPVQMLTITEKGGVRVDTIDEVANLSESVKSLPNTDNVLKMLKGDEN
jgi:hypothetical protein